MAIGMLFAYCRDKIIRIYDRYRFILIALYAPLFVFLFVYYCKNTNGEAQSVLMLTVMISSSILFVLNYTLTVYLFPVKSRLLDFYGKISLEFYLLQNLFIEIIPIRSFISNDLLFSLCVLLLTTVAAYLLNAAVTCIFKRPPKRNHTSPHLPEDILIRCKD